MSLDDRLRRGLPPLAAEADPDVEPALHRAVSRGRRRRTLFLLVIFLLALSTFIVRLRPILAVADRSRSP